MATDYRTGLALVWGIVWRMAAGGLLAGLAMGGIYGLILVFPVGVVYGLILGAVLGLMLGCVEGALMALVTLVGSVWSTDLENYRRAMGFTSLVPVALLLMGLVLALILGGSMSAWTAIEFGALVIAGVASWFVALRVADWAEFEIRTLRERRVA